MRTENQERTELCQKILGKVQVVLDDSPEVKEKVNRATKGGVCFGYYEVLTKYDPETDLFNNHIPASKVERVAFAEALDKCIAKFVELFARKETINANQ